MRGPTCISSGLKEADAAIMATPGYFFGVLLRTDGTNEATIALYDDPDSADGTVLAAFGVPGADLARYWEAPCGTPIWCSHGIWADVTGTDAKYYVYYLPGPTVAG